MSKKFDKKSTYSVYERMGYFAATPYSLMDDPRLSGNALLVWDALIRHADNDLVCWPSYETIGRLARLKPTSVGYALNELEDAGWLTRKKRMGASTVYKLTPPFPDKLLPSSSGEAGSSPDDATSSLNDAISSLNEASSSPNNKELDTLTRTTELEPRTRSTESEKGVDFRSSGDEFVEESDPLYIDYMKRQEAYKNRKPVDPEDQEEVRYG